MELLQTLAGYSTAVFGSTWGPPLWVLVKTLVIIILIAVPLILCVAYLTLAERKVIGYMQVRIGPNRVGPLGLLQPFADVFKLLFKEVIIPTGANKFLFFLAPMMVLMPALAAWAVIPFSPGVVLADINAGLLYVMAITSMGVYGVIIAGWASNSKYAFLGAMRSAAQIVSYEIAMGFALVCVLMVSQSLNLGDIVHAQARGYFAGVGVNFCPGTGCRCSRCSSCTSSRRWRRPTARRSTSPKASRRSSPASTSSTRAWRSRCSSSPST